MDFRSLDLPVLEHFQQCGDECKIAHRRSVAALCMLSKIRCNRMLPLYGALSLPFVALQVTCGAFVAYRYTSAPPRCRTSLYRRIFILLSISLQNDLGDPVFDGVGLASVRVRPMRFFFGLSCSLIFCLQLFSISSFFIWVGIVRLGPSDL